MIRQRNRNESKIATVNWFLPPDLVTMAIWPWRPGIVPTIVSEFMRMKYGMFNPFDRSRVIEAAKVVNITQYIPVAEATAGCISS